MKTIEARNAIRGAAQFVFPDERAYYLSEMNLQAAVGQGWHRYQIIGVARDDQLADCHIDMGPVSQFEGIDQLRVITAVDTSNGRTESLYTVEEAMDLADQLRGIYVDRSEWPVLDLMNLYQDYEEKRVRNNAS